MHAHEDERIGGEGVVCVDLGNEIRVALHVVIEVQPAGLTRPVGVMLVDATADAAKGCPVDE